MPSPVSPLLTSAPAPSQPLQLSGADGPSSLRGRQYVLKGAGSLLAGQLSQRLPPPRENVPALHVLQSWACYGSQRSAVFKAREGVPAGCSAGLQKAAGAAADGARQVGHVGGEGEAEAAGSVVVVREEADALVAAFAVCVRDLRQE
jgi:hypothetical protein